VQPGLGGNMSDYQWWVARTYGVLPATGPAWTNSPAAATTFQIPLFCRDKTGAPN
jgi:hypothetical protein